MSITKIAMLGAFPPPISGQALAAQILADGLDPNEFTLYKLDFSESIGGDSTLSRVARIAKVAANLIAVCVKEKELIVYLQMGYGRASILRDIVFLSISKLFGKKTIVHIHGSAYRVAFDSLPAPIKVIEKALLKSIDTFIVLSDCLKPMFEGLVDNERIVSVPNGVAQDVIDAAATFERAKRNEGEVFNVLFLSNLLKIKGYETVLYTALKAKEHNENWHFDIVGPKVPNQGVDVEEFIRDNQLSDIITWHDTAQGEQKMNMFKKAHCFIMPSFYEGQPLCIIEAMHFSLPVILKPVGGHPDIFAENPDGAIYIGNPPALGSQPDPAIINDLIKSDADHFYNALCDLYKDTDRCHNMGATNRELALRVFTPEAHVKQMSGIFKK